MSQPEKLEPVENVQSVIINDCSDPNARARQEVRFASLFDGVKPTFIGLGRDDPDLEAAGQLVDVLDAIRTPNYDNRTGKLPFPDTNGVVLVNVAPRGDAVREKWENGTPFGYVEIGEFEGSPDVTVFAPFEGRTLPLLSRLGLANKVHLLDIPEVVATFVKERRLDESEAKAIANSQFRSFEFLPLAARYHLGGGKLPVETHPIPESQATDNRFWLIDSFGNGKTTLLPDDVGFEDGKPITLAGGQEVTCYSRLADVPTGELGLTIGSSGYGENRWLETVKQGGSAAEELGFRVGSRVIAHEAVA